MHLRRKVRGYVRTVEMSVLNVHSVLSTRESTPDERGKTERALQEMTTNPMLQSIASIHRSVTGTATLWTPSQIQGSEDVYALCESQVPILSKPLTNSKSVS